MPVITFFVVAGLWGICSGEVFEDSRNNKIALKSIYLLTGVKHFNTITTDTTGTIVNMLKNKSVGSLRIQISEYAKT